MNLIEHNRCRLNKLELLLKKMNPTTLSEKVCRNQDVLLTDIGHTNILSLEGEQKVRNVLSKILENQELNVDDLMTLDNYMYGKLAYQSIGTLYSSRLEPEEAYRRELFIEFTGANLSLYRPDEDLLLTHTAKKFHNQITEIKRTRETNEKKESKTKHFLKSIFKKNNP